MSKQKKKPQQETKNQIIFATVLMNLIISIIEFIKELMR